MQMLHDLLEKQLRNLYAAETLILERLPEILNHASDKGLKDIINAIIEVTDQQRSRLKKIGDYLNFKVTVRDGKIIKGLLEEMKELFEEFSEGNLLDIAIISQLQHIQHFQISAYESTLLYTKTLLLEEISSILDDTIDEAYMANENCSRYMKLLLSRKKR